MLIKTIGIGATETFQTNYLGTYLLLVSTGDIGSNTIVKVVPMGDGVLVDLDEAGVDAIGVWKLIGADNNRRRVIPLADGLVPNKVVDITITNGGAATMDVYMPVTKKGTMYIQCVQQTILANSQAIFKDFSALFLNAMTGENGQITVDWRDGSSHTFSPQELIQFSMFFQDTLANVLDNLGGNVRKVTIIPTADLKVQLVRYRKVGAL
jgi:hypothetical protein